MVSMEDTFTIFQSTLPKRGATLGIARQIHYVYFNPRSPNGERRAEVIANSSLCDFNPRSPNGERRGRATDALSELISIHAPQTGSDQQGRGAWRG